MNTKWTKFSFSSEIYLKPRMWGTVAGDWRLDGVQDGVHWRVEGAAESNSQNLIGEKRQDADCGLGPNLLKRMLDGVAEVDDLGSLEDLAGGHVEAGHISGDVGIANYRN